MSKTKTSKITTVDLSKVKPGVGYEKDVLNQWTLICHFCLYTNTVVSLPEDDRGRIYQGVWSLTDAYGPVGFVPPQGYDWSGIRDSTEAAQTRMAEGIVQFLTNRGVTQYVVEERP